MFPNLDAEMARKKLLEVRWQKKSTKQLQPYL